VTVELDDEDCHRLVGSDFCHHVFMVCHLIVVRVLDESLACKMTKSIEVVCPVVEDASVPLQGLNRDCATAGSLDRHMKSTRAQGFIRSITAVVDTIAHTSFFDALRVGTPKMHIVIHIGWASGTSAQVCRHEMIRVSIAP
jgi:hypothetical protein